MICVTITGEEKVERGKEGLTQREEGLNRAVNEGDGKGKRDGLLSMATR